MKQLLLCFLIGVILLSGCSGETIDQETAAPGRSVVELVAFGASENPTVQNKGLDAAYYCYIDLDTDSVFVQKRLNLDEQVKAQVDEYSSTFAWTGTIEGVSQNQEVLSLIEASQETKNGNIVSTLPDGSFFYDGYHYYFSYRKGGSDKFQFFTTHDLETRFEKGTSYLMALYQHDKLRQVTELMNTDSIVTQLVNRPAFSEGRLPPPPPPVKVNYTPPLEKH